MKRRKNPAGRVRIRGWGYRFLLVGASLLSGCSTLGYYAQAVHGHLSLLERSRPVADLVQDPETPASLRHRLAGLLTIREFASRELLLPDNASYRGYAELEGDSVVWTVTAAGEFSVDAKRWCYPVIGCASYRGYFSRAAGQTLADELRRQGLDVALAGVPAYSTLGWTDDPLPSTVIDWPEARLAGLVFHELAHQELYVRDDSAFNEAFASSVEQVGVERWLRSRGDLPGLQEWSLQRRREQQLIELLLAVRQRLKALYARHLDAQETRERKAAEVRRLEQEYLKLKQRWGGYDAFDPWMQRLPWNNARLATVATYHDLVPGFMRLLQQQQGDLAGFYRACRHLGSMDPAQRRRTLQALASSDQ